MATTEFGNLLREVMNAHISGHGPSVDSCEFCTKTREILKDDNFLGKMILLTRLVSGQFFPVIHESVTLALCENFMAGYIAGTLCERAKKMEEMFK